VTGFNESTVELAALEYLRQLGYSTQFGPNLAPDGITRERTSFEQVYLYDRR
jgi:type I restriction enzyme, R subunit